MSTKPERPQIPPDMKAFNEKLIEEFRANRGQLSGQMARSQVLLLTTTGARSGLPRTVVIGYRPHGESYVSIASNNGNDHAPAWYHNLLAKPLATIEVGPERRDVRARTATAEERLELAGVIDYLERQQALTKREIPIVIFERVESSPP
jgi:deazaflavin-dependent oxidoreductase (nitroreductase family)